MSPEQVGEILTVAEAFKENYILDNASQLLTRTLSDERSFFRVALCILESKGCQDNPGIMAGIFKELCDSVYGKALPTQPLCDEMRQYWQGSSQDHSRQSSLRLEAYRELQGGRSHDLNHQYQNLLTKIDEGLSKGIQEGWAAYQSNLLNILSRVRLVISSGVSEHLCNSLEEKHTNLMRQQNESNKLVVYRSQLPNSDDDVEILKLLKESAEETWVAWAGIGEDLDKLRTSLKEKLYAVLLNCKEDLEKKKIKCVRQLPDDLCLVFGEPGDISLALCNLVDNVCNWSRATSLLIEVTFDKSNKSVRLRMFDNGHGMPEDLFFGVGLTRVKEIARALYGHFKLSEVSERDSRFKEGFRTVAELALPSISINGNPA